MPMLLAWMLWLEGPLCARVAANRPAVSARVPPIAPFAAARAEPEHARLGHYWHSRWERWTAQAAPRCLEQDPPLSGGPSAPYYNGLLHYVGGLAFSPYIGRWSTRMQVYPPGVFVLNVSLGEAGR